MAAIPVFIDRPVLLLLKRFEFRFEMAKFDIINFAIYVINLR